MDISKMQLSRAVLARIRRGSLFHAYIISGRTKEERMTLARAIAKATVCAVPGENPCGQCENCYKAERNIHPDIMVITKLEDKKELPVEAGEGVRYVCPQKMVSTEENVDLYFRTLLPGRNTTLTISDDTGVLVTKKLVRTTPGTIEKLTLPADKAKNVIGKIVVCAEHKEA